MFSLSGLLTMTVFGMLMMVVNGVAMAEGGAEDCMVACLRATSTLKGCDGLSSADKLGDWVRAAYANCEGALCPDCDDFNPTHVSSSIDTTRDDGSAIDLPFEEELDNEVKSKRGEEDPMVHPLPGHRGSPGRGGGLSWCGVTGASCAAADGDDDGGGGGDIQGGETATSTDSASTDSASTTVNSDNTKREEFDIAAAAGTRGGGRGEGRNPFNWCGVPGMSCLDDAEEEEEGKEENGTTTDLKTTTADLPVKRDDSQRNNDPVVDYSSEQCDCFNTTCGHADNRKYTSAPVVTMVPTPAISTTNNDPTHVTVIYHTIIQYETVIANEVPQLQKIAVPVTTQAVTTTATVTELEGSHLLVVSADATGPYVIDAHPPMNGGVGSGCRIRMGMVVLLGIVAGVVGFV